jgi:CRP-like cAMP-binding protein
MPDDKTQRIEDWDRIMRQLPAVGVLENFSRESLETLAGYGEYEMAKPNDDVIYEGAPQDRLYIVVQGKLDVIVRVSGNEMKLADIEIGECFGEARIFIPGMASATVKAREKALLWAINARGLRKYMTEHPGGAGNFLLGVARCLCQRLRDVNQRIAEHELPHPPPISGERMKAITVDNIAMPKGFFDKLKSSKEKKVKIRTDIKM